jgi:hypothetical protein
MWEDRQYCWVVFCKNWLFHLRQNIFHRHRIPLGFSDGITRRPPIDARFRRSATCAARNTSANPLKWCDTNRSRPSLFSHIPYFRKRINPVQI